MTIPVHPVELLRRKAELDRRAAANAEPKALTSAERIRMQRWEVARARAMRLIQRYDPDQPRDETGKWTSGGGAGGIGEGLGGGIGAIASAQGRLVGTRAAGADQRVSTSIPSPAAAKKAGITPHKQRNLQPSYKTFSDALKNPKFDAGTAKVLNKYGDEFLRLPKNATTEQKAEAFVEHAKSNIKALYNAYGEYRERAKLWYQGANKMAHDLGKEYGVSPKAVAGVIASLSPQRDWDQNVDLAKRVLDVAIKNKDVPFSGSAATKAKAAMDAYREKQLEDIKKIRKDIRGETSPRKIQAAEKKIKNRKEMADLIEDLSKNFRGKTLSELPLDQQPVMLRFASVTQDPTSRGYEVWNPEGTPSGNVQLTKKGAVKKAGWGGFDQIGNALSCLRDDSSKNISQSLGDNHKVRNFYNNIIAPDYGEDATIDTHAVAASTLMPLGQSSAIVKQGLGMSGPKNAATGLKGMYALHYEAYRRAANEIAEEEGRVVLPREMQSAAWEALRGLYSDEEKRNKDIRANATAIWKQYRDGEIKLEEAQQQILGKASPTASDPNRRGIRPPRWAQ